MKDVCIDGRKVGKGEPVFIIAEAGINHNGSLESALRLIDAAADAGCDAVKFQKRNPRKLLSREAYDKPYKNGGNSYGRTYGEHRERLELSRDDFRSLQAYAVRRSILFCASAWDEDSAAFLGEIDIPLHKIGSPDLTNLPLCGQIAEMGKPILLSTGMSRLDEVVRAVETILAINADLVLLHCVSIYPTPPEKLRLRCIPMLESHIDLPVGYSGHDAGWSAAIAAVTLGACVVEKHITLDRTQKGGDHHFSLEPDELREMVVSIRGLEKALKGEEKVVWSEELPFREKLGKSVATTREIAPGELITPEMLTCKSPGTGISPLNMERLLGTEVSRGVQGDMLLREPDILFKREEGK